MVSRVVLVASSRAVVRVLVLGVLYVLCVYLFILCVYSMFVKGDSRSDLLGVANCPRA